MEGGALTEPWQAAYRMPRMVELETAADAAGGQSCAVPVSLAYIGVQGGCTELCTSILSTGNMHIHCGTAYEFIN